MGFPGAPGVGDIDVGIYHRIISTRPQNLIKYHPMWESQGLTSLDYSWRRNNGLYTGVTLGDPGPGDGRFAPSFDGLTDFNNIYSAGFAADFNGAEFTVELWGACTAAMLTDGQWRNLIYISVDVNNRVVLQKSNVNNLFYGVYVAGGVNLNRSFTMSDTKWHHWAITGSKINNQVKIYLDGVQQGATLVGLGVWAGALVANGNCIGAQNTVPNQVHLGWLAHAAISDVALTPQEITRNARRM